MNRPRLLSVSEAATELKASEAYVRRLLLGQRLYGIKVGPVWAIFPDDLEAFKSLRRPPGRPRTREALGQDQASTARIARERIRAGTDPLLRKRRTARAIDVPAVMQPAGTAYDQASGTLARSRIRNPSAKS